MTLEEKQEYDKQQSLKWREYFRNDKNVALDFLTDMENALKADYIDSIDAEICLKGIAAKIRSLNPEIKRAELRRVPDWTRDIR